MRSDHPSFEPVRRLRFGAQILVSTVALATVLVLVNYLAATRRVWRFDLAAGEHIELSPLTRQTLSTLTNDLNITVLFRSSSGLFPQVTALLREYEIQSPKVKVRYFDSERDPERVGVLKVQYQLGARVGDVVVFELGGQRRTVSEGELSVYNQDDIQALMGGKSVEVRRSAFQGEWRFTAAITALLETSQSRAVLLVGHGEHPWDGEGNEGGYSKFSRLLEREKNLSIQPLDLTTNELPTDCQLVVISGPTGVFLASEISRLEAFLQRGGRILLLLSPYAADRRTGLEGWLARWGVEVPAQYAGDRTEFSDGRLGLWTKSLGIHPLMTPLRREDGVLYFPFPRVVRPIPVNHLPVDAPKVDILASTSKGGTTKSDLVNFAFDASRGDIRNAEVPLAVAVEKGGVAGVAAARGGARMVVIGDSFQFANNALEQPDGHLGNHDFAALCVSWLLDRPQSLAIGPKPIREWKLKLTAPQERTLQWTLLAVLPGIVLTMGFLVWSRRRA